jgi:hypothetical protein
MMTGSTTLAGITAWIARNMGKRKLPKLLGGAVNTTNNNRNNSTTTASSSSCTARLVPMKARRLRERIAEKSFLWSVVREPVQRVVSKFFHFAVSGEGVEPTVKKLQTFVWDMENADYAYYFKSLSLRQSLNAYRDDLHETYVQEILQGYDFLGVSERMDESLAVLQLLLGLETQDSLFAA